MRRLLDRIGVVAGIACAAHCLLAPLVAMVFVTASSVIVPERFHSYFVVSLVLVGLISVGMGVLHHRRYRAAFTMTLATLLAVFILLCHEWLEANAFWHGACYSALGILVVISHIINYRLTHTHVHDATCRGDH